ncbi:hypothetical protein LTR15_002433 [Elasticomyces elasticus]|nr:hypothetical protein LTR15_002433 [Elasticomyces elasticus]
MVSFLDGDNGDEFLRLSGMCPQGQRTQGEPFAGGPEYGTFDGATSPFPAAAPSPFAPFAPSAPFPPLDVGFGNLDNFDINDFDLSDGMLFEGEVEDNGEQDDNRGIVPIGERWEDDGGEQVEELDDADCTAGPRYTNRPAANQLRSTEYHAVPRRLTATDANTLQYQGFGRTQHSAVGLYGMPANIAPATNYFPPAQTGWSFGHIPTPAELAFRIAPFTAQTGYGTNEPFGASTMNTPHQHHQRQPQTQPVRYQHRRQERALDTSASLSPPASYAAQQDYGMQQPHLLQAQPPSLKYFCSPYWTGLQQYCFPNATTVPSDDSHGFGSSSSLSSSTTGAGMWRDHLGNTGVSGHHGQDESLPPPRLRRRTPRSPQLDPARIEDLTTILDDFRHQPNTASGPADSAPEFLEPSSRLRRRRQPTSTQGAIRPTSSSSSGTNITRRKNTQRDAGRTTDDRKKPTKVTKASLRSPDEEKTVTKKATSGVNKGKTATRIKGRNPELGPGQAARADVALPETRATGVELLCFFPNHTQWPGVLRRLLKRRRGDEEIAAARLYFRGAVQEDRVKRHWRQIRKQKNWAKDVQSVEDYGLSDFAPRRTQRSKEPQHELLAEIGRNVVEWPEPSQQSFLTLAIIFAIAHPEMGYTTDDVEWLAESLEWVLPCDFTNDLLDEQGHDEIMKAMEDEGFWE